MAVIPKSTPRALVVQARDPKVIAREKARAARLAIPQPSVVRGTVTANSTGATAAEIAEALRFAGDPKRPDNCMMATLAAERIIMHLESRGFTLVASDKKPSR